MLLLNSKNVEGALNSEENLKLQEALYIALKALVGILWPLVVLNLSLGTFFYIRDKFFLYLDLVPIIIGIVFLGPLIVLFILMLYYYFKKLKRTYPYFCLFAGISSTLFFYGIVLYPEDLVQSIIFLSIVIIFVLVPTPKNSILLRIFRSMNSVFLQGTTTYQSISTGYAGMLGIYSISILSGLFGCFDIYPLLGYFMIFIIFGLRIYLKRLVALKSSKNPVNYHVWLSRFKNINTLLIILAFINFFSQFFYLGFRTNIF